MKSEAKQTRDKANGQFGFTVSRPCVCGHSLDVHTAQAPHTCIAGDFGQPCECEKFRPARRAK